MTIAGGQVLLNVLSYRRVGSVAGPPQAPPSAPRPQTSGPLAMTGSDLPVAPAAALVVLVALLVRRRTSRSR